MLRIVYQMCAHPTKLAKCLQDNVTKRTHKSCAICPLGFSRRCRRRRGVNVCVWCVCGVYIILRNCAFVKDLTRVARARFCCARQPESIVGCCCLTSRCVYCAHVLFFCVFHAWRSFNKMSHSIIVNQNGLCVMCHTAHISIARSHCLDLYGGVLV